MPWTAWADQAPRMMNAELVARTLPNQPSHNTQITENVVYPTVGATYDPSSRLSILLGQLQTATSTTFYGDLMSAAITVVRRVSSPYNYSPGAPRTWTNATSNYLSAGQIVVSPMFQFDDWDYAGYESGLEHGYQQYEADEPLSVDWPSTWTAKLFNGIYINAQKSGYYTGRDVWDAPLVTAVAPHDYNVMFMPGSAYNSTYIYNMKDDYFGIEGWPKPSDGTHVDVIDNVATPYIEGGSGYFSHLTATSTFTFDLDSYGVSGNSFTLVISPTILNSGASLNPDLSISMAQPFVTDQIVHSPSGMVSEETLISRVDVLYQMFIQDSDPAFALQALVTPPRMRTWFSEDLLNPFEMPLPFPFDDTPIGEVPGPDVYPIGDYPVDEYPVGSYNLGGTVFVADCYAYVYEGDVTA